MSLKRDELDFWIKNNLNVLLRGKHGIGKTHVVLDAFRRNKLRYLYFSASTLDPWVDFIGIPKEKVNVETGISHIELIRPEALANDEVDAIFFDEINRAPKKVRNAIMELIQFKAINGKQFKNLRMIWGAANPKEDEDGNNYDVEELDPAQADRFEVQRDLPYEPSLAYLSEKYSVPVAEVAINWWKQLEPKQKNCVSPRRLDYALGVYEKKGNLRDVLPVNVNSDALARELISGPTSTVLRDFMSKNDREGARAWLAQAQNYHMAEPYIREDVKFLEFFATLIEDEKMCMLASKYPQVTNHLFADANFSVFEDTIRMLAEADSGNLGDKAKKVIERLGKTKKKSK